jgi:hypothetical protein
VVKIKGSVQAIAVIFVVLGMGLIHVGYQTNVTREQLSDLEIRVSELGGMIVECGVTIDNGAGATTETVHLTKGATALEALRRVAVVETTYYMGLGEFIDKINGVGKETGKYWAFYYWSENDWRYAEVGAGSYKVKDVDNIKFVYTSW